MRQITKKLSGFTKNYEGNFQGGVVGGGPLVINLILFSR